MLFLEKFGQEIRPDAQKISHCITLLMAKWDGGFGGGGGGKKLFPQRCNRRDGESKRKQSREFLLLYSNTPLGR